MLAKGKRLLAWMFLSAFLLSSVTAYAAGTETGAAGAAEEHRAEAEEGGTAEDTDKENQTEEIQAAEEIKKTEITEEVKTVRARAAGSAANVETSRTITDVLGIKPDSYLSYVEKYTASGNSYYLGTPYPTKEQAGRYGGGIYDFRSPNGDKWQGFGLMQCTGFVWHVLVGAGAREAQTPHMSLRSSYHSLRPYQLSGWYTWMTENKISYHNFANKNDMLRSGTLDYGDIIWIWDENAGGCTGISDYHHIGIYIGDGSSDRMWHSIEGKGNIISEIVGKASRVSFTVVDTTEKGEVKLKKQSSNTAVTGGNSCYSLEGAEYEVYKDSDCTISAGTLITDENGESNVLTLVTGTYYVKETKVPPGFALDTQIYEVTLKAGEKEPQVLTVSDVPVMNSVDLLLQKKDAETNQNSPQGKAGFEGAHFEVSYYKGLFNEDPALSGRKAERTWTLMTDEKGECRLNDRYFVSGDAFYQSSSGQPAFPLGTVTIRETQAPEGYLLNPDVYVVRIAGDNTGSESVQSYNAPEIPENILKLKILKVIKDMEQTVPGAVFRHTLPDGSAEQVTTDQNGEAVLKGLTWGEHVIEEVSIPEGIVRNPGRVTFTVEKGNKVTVISNTSEDETGEITFITEESGNVSMKAEDVLAPYELIVHKQNEKEKKLQGAEFTLYEDKDCKKEIKKAVSQADGRVYFGELEVGAKYYLKETKAPEGYRIPAEEDESPIIYEIYTKSNPIQGIFEYYVNGQERTEISGTAAAREVNLTVVNHTGVRMPETGNPQTAGMMMTGTLFMALSMVIWRRMSYGRNV